MHATCIATYVNRKEKDRTKAIPYVTCMCMPSLVSIQYRIAFRLWSSLFVYLVAFPMICGFTNGTGNGASTCRYVNVVNSPRTYDISSFIQYGDDTIRYAMQYHKVNFPSLFLSMIQYSTVPVYMSPLIWSYSTRTWRTVLYVPVAFRTCSNSIAIFLNWHPSPIIHHIGSIQRWSRCNQEATGADTCSMKTYVPPGASKRETVRNTYQYGNERGGRVNWSRSSRSFVSSFLVLYPIPIRSLASPTSCVSFPTEHNTCVVRTVSYFPPCIDISNSCVNSLRISTGKDTPYRSVAFCIYGCIWRFGSIIVYDVIGAWRRHMKLIPVPPPISITLPDTSFNVSHRNAAMSFDCVAVRRWNKLENTDKRRTKQSKKRNGMDWDGMSEYDHISSYPIISSTLVTSRVTSLFVHFSSFRLISLPSCLISLLCFK